MIYDVIQSLVVLIENWRFSANIYKGFIVSLTLQPINLYIKNYGVIEHLDKRQKWDEI